jgi:serine/threonine protein kinase
MPATDVYASAVVLYEMFTGRTPWVREAVMRGARTADDFRLPAGVFASAPMLADEIQHHIMRLGDPDPARRPSTAQALAESQRLRERLIAAGAL